MNDTLKSTLDTQILILRTIVNALRNIYKRLSDKPPDNRWVTKNPSDMKLETRRNTYRCAYLMLYAAILDLLSVYSHHINQIYLDKLISISAFIQHLV